MGTQGWSCSTHDPRGRILTQSHPPNGAEAVRTVSYDYAVGAITTTTDALGRIMAHSDVWGQTTTSVHDTAGRPTRSQSPAALIQGV